MLVQLPSPPRLSHTLNSPLNERLNYQFCFLNRPFVSEDNPKDVYYKLLIWPKAETIIDDFSFLIKINHQGALKPLEILENSSMERMRFDPWGDSYLTIKIPQAFYQSQMDFAFSFKALGIENYGQIFLDLNLINQYRLDNQLIFYNMKTSESTNLLTWDLATKRQEITFNATYPTLLELNTHLTDLTFKTAPYESVKKLRFLGLLDAQPRIKNFSVESLATKKKAYDFQPQIKWWSQGDFNRKDYHLQLLNRLALVGDQIKEVDEGDSGFKANPYVTIDQTLSLNFSFLSQEFQLPFLVRQAVLDHQATWEGVYFEV